MTDTLWWILSTLLILAGIAGAVLPALPGTALVLAGIVLAAWFHGFTRVGVGVIAVVSVLAAIGWLLDYAAGMLGARKAGASRQALIGAAIGTVAGVFAGFIGVLFLPLVGAAIGEYLARRDELRALHVGVATWLGIMAGMVAKVVIVFMMTGIFVGALVL
jgi:uncharacterized protein YqgC (DUF456 family)